MKNHSLLHLFLLCGACLLLLPAAHAANPSFDSFATNDFIKIPPYIYLRHTNSSGTNVFNGNVTIYTNSTINIDNSTNIINNSYTIYTNSSVTFNGTNLATINPTIGRIPYNADGTNFLDSSLYYIDPDTVGANELRTDLMVFNPAPTQALPTGVNLLNPFEVSFMPLAASTTTPTDTQIRLSTGNGVGALLVLQNYNGDAFELLNGDALWDDPAAHVYLSGGDWKPDTIGQAMLLIGTSQGWAEIGRFGGSTNVVTESLWQYSGGYLQPVDLTQPLFWTNSVTWGPGTTNSLLRDGINLVYSSPKRGGIAPYLVVTNTTEANQAMFGSGGNLALIQGVAGVALFDDLISANDVRWSAHYFAPTSDTHAQLGADMNSIEQPWYQVNSWTNAIYGFRSNTNYSRLSIYHTGTNGTPVFDSQALGSAGPARDFQVSSNGVRVGTLYGTALNYSSLGYPGYALAGGYFTNVYVSNAGIGDIDLLTAPTGYRIMVWNIALGTTNATGTTTVIGELKVSGTYYRIAANATFGTNGSGSFPAGVIVEPGDTYALNNNTTGANFVATGIVYPISVNPLKSHVLTGVVAGNNTLLTVGAGKRYYPYVASAFGNSNFLYANNTGSPVVINIYIVPNGGSVGNATLFRTATVNSGSQSAITLPPLEAGASVVLNSDSSTAGQIVYLTGGEWSL